jgi:hypothetical protein
VIASDKLPTFALMFGVICAALYVVCTEVNLPLVTYHPVIGEIDLLWQPPRRGPAMYWYGWMLTAAIVAVPLALLATAVPAPWLQRTLTFACVLAAAYVAIYTLALWVYDKATVELEFLKWRSLSLAAAAVVAAIATAIAPAAWNKRLWHGWIWLVPVGALGVLAYYLTPYFTR